MRISSIPVAWRIGMAVVAPILAMILFAALFTYEQFVRAERVNNVREAVEFSTDISQLVHQLQRERGRSAGFVGAGGQGEFRAQLLAQRDDTDAVLKRYSEASALLKSGDLSETLLQRIGEAEDALLNLSAHRIRVEQLSLSMGETVGPYTQAVRRLLAVVAEQTHGASSASGAGSETVVAFLGLMHAKEYAGVERAVGSNAFATGKVTQSNHKRSLDLAARQEAFFEEYRELMPAEWVRRLDEVLASPASEAVAVAREVLHDGGYADSVSGYTGPEWFELTTRRIDALMELETDVARYLTDRATAEGEALRRSAILTMTLALVIAIGAMLFSAFLMASVVRPIKRITKYLDRLARGETDVEIIGADRGDEIGVLCRSAEAFRTATREREDMMRENAKMEQEAVENRRRLLTGMAEEVKSAAQASVGGVATEADNLEQVSERMRIELERAGQKANDADAATSETMEKTEHATRLASEITAGVGEVTEQVARGNTLAREAVEKAASSRESISELEQAARQVSEFVEIISDLAEQTNLLALNATIEAARAGHSGRGFAVVASEVKGLAAQTNRSTAQIAERVQQIQARTEAAVSSMSSIANSIDSLGDVTGSIAAAIEEQRATTSSFADFMGENRAALRNVADQISEVASIASGAADDASSMAGRVKIMANLSNEASQSIPEIVQRSIDMAERRSAPRAPSSATLSVEQSGGAITASLKNVSETGAKVDGVLNAADGEVRLRGPNVDAEAEVVWKGEGDTGVRFKTPLDRAAFDSLTGGETTAPPKSAAG